VAPSSLSGDRRPTPALAQAVADALTAIRAGGTHDKLFDKFGIAELKATALAIRGEDPTNPSRAIHASWVRRKSDSLVISTATLRQARTCAFQTSRNCTRLYLF
jgi:hypothetical protein